MNVKQIKFNVDMPAKTVRLEGAKGLIRVPQGPKELIWSLGKGPCGRFVEGLEVTITLAALTIKQVSYEHDSGAIMDGWRMHAANPNPSDYTAILKAYEANALTREIKSFIYKLEDIRGRIEAIEVG